MLRIRRLTVVAVLLLTARTASADGPVLAHHYDPPPSYSPFRYWLPGLARCYDRHCGAKLNVYPPDRHPEIVPFCVILGYPHPAVDPAATLIERPKPPPESRFRYGP